VIHFISDNGRKRARMDTVHGQSAELAKIRSNGNVMKYLFSRTVIERWNQLDQQVSK